MTPLPISTLDDLKREASRDGGLNGFIALNGGARSSKLFSYEPEGDSWSTLHEITDTWAEYPSTDAMLAGEGNITEALEAGGVWAHWIDQDASLPEPGESSPSHGF